jgi:hypothetical protein
MRDDELLDIVDQYGHEQILLDAEMTIDRVMLLLHELGYVDLTIYEEER